LVTTFSKRGNVTLYLVEQNFWISSGEPGSWLPKSLLGKRGSRSFLSFSSSCQLLEAGLYWGVETALAGDVDHQRDLAGIILQVRGLPSSDFVCSL